MHKKITKTILLVTLLVLLIGITSATTITDNTTTNKVTKDTNTAPYPEIQKSNEKIVENKIIKKENKNKIVKTATVTKDVDSYSELVNTVKLANKSINNYTINLQSGTYLATANMTWENNRTTLTINGNGTTLNGRNKYNFICNAEKLILNNITFVNFVKTGEYGYVTDLYGGVIYNYGELIINNCKFIDNSANEGGAIYNGGKLTIKNSLFSDNMASTSGGAIKSSYGSNNIEKSIFKNNKAEWNGGAISTGTNNATITNNLFINNQAIKNGGAIYNGMLVSHPYSTVFYDRWGNRIESEDTPYGMNTEITDNRFISNKAVKGSAIYNYVYSVLIDSNIFNANLASSSSTGVIVTTTDNIIEYNNTYNSVNWYKSTISNDGENTRIINNLFDDSKLPVELIIQCNNTNPYVNETIDITFILKDEYNNNLQYEMIDLTINNESYTLTTDDDGLVTLKYTPTIIGTIPITVEYDGDDIYNSIIKTTKFIVKNKINTKTTVQTTRGVIGEKLTLNATVTDINGNKVNEGNLIFKLNGITIKDNGKVTGSNNSQNVKVNNGIASTTIIPDSNMINVKNITAEYIGTNTYSPSIGNTAQITIQKRNITLTLKSVKGIIGETITLQAILKDTNGTPISGGNLAFKLNGKTLRSDGRFDSSAPAMKFRVKDGFITYTIKADLYLRNAKTLEASYSGTNNYYESTSPSVTAQIQKRNAQVTVTTTPSKAKHYESLTFTIKATDITKNGKNNTLIYTDTKVMLKVNGVTLKDANGKPVYVTLDKNAQATYKYTIPAGTGGITASKAARNYKVDAIFVGDNYYPGARNTTTFQVERSTTTVTITQARTTKTNVLNVKATLKDYKGNNLIGTNKVTIKINGKSYTKNGKPVYWSVKNGNIDLTGIQVDPKTTIKRVLLVTGERQAYTEGRAETTNIIRT